MSYTILKTKRAIQAVNEKMIKIEEERKVKTQEKVDWFRERYIKTHWYSPETWSRDPDEWSDEDIYEYLEENGGYFSPYRMGAFPSDYMWKTYDRLKELHEGFIANDEEKVIVSVDDFEKFSECYI